ncbi:MAG: exonuclease SbcCD subunit D [Spirochaetota bacterium]|nr:exonuclease SbcCD subunit D [Spirochaetota bacterium]
MPVFIHLSDSHLGFNDFDKVNDDGINQREADVYNAFANAVDSIIQYKPDFVIHTGDLFHRSSPSNRALIQGLQHIKRITQAGIPFIVIAGNHCTPKTIYTSPILQALQTIDGVYAVYKGEYECFSLDGIHLHCLPHIHEDAEFITQIKKIEPEQRHNILLMHTSLGKDYLLDEYGERIFPEEYFSLLKEFDYVALGHWHNFNILPRWENVCYSGSTERFSDREAGKQKGFVTVTIGTKTNIEFNPITIRDWVRFDIKTCSEYSVEDIKKNIQELSSQVAQGAIVSVYLHDIDAHQSVAVSNMWIAQQFPQALVVLPKRIFKKQRSDSSSYKEHISIEEVFAAYCKQSISDEKEREAVEALGKHYFIKYREQFSDIKE